MTWLVATIIVMAILGGVWLMLRRMQQSVRRAEEAQEQKLAALRQEWSHTLHQTH